jgi:hypothetical protein
MAGNAEHRADAEVTRHDNTGEAFRGHIFIDGGLWPSWEAYARYAAANGTYTENACSC